MSSYGLPNTGVQNVSLNAPNDYLAQQMQIQRAQQLAKALQEQGSQDIPVMTGGGSPAPIAWTSLLAKALDKVGSSMQSNRAISEQKALSAQQQAAALKAIQGFSQNPDTQGLVPGTPKPSAPMQYTLQAPSVIPGQEGPSATGSADLPGVGGVQAGTIPGGPTTLAQKQQMLPQMAMQGADNPYMQAALPALGAQMQKPDIRAIGPEGLAQVMPDGTVKQVVPGREPIAPKQTLEEQFVAGDMKANPKETMAEAEHKWAVAKHVTDPNSGGMNAANNLTGEEIAALNQGIASGQIDAGKVNSRTAKIMAHMYMGDPTVNQVNSAGHAAMVRSPGMQQRVMTAQALPQILDNVRQAGKKLNFSDLAFAGKLQAFAKGQLNDPDFINYMTQRNDAVMGIASVMRGVGMSDKAVEMESDAAPKSMSPKAFEGWYQAQIKSLEPRLKQYGGVALGPIQPGTQATPPKTIRFEDMK